MPTWNRQQLAIRAIKSVLRQDYPHWEMIVVDDCSSNFEQLEQYVADLNDPRVTYVRNAFNSGACGVTTAADDLGYPTADVTAAFAEVGVACDG